MTVLERLTNRKTLKSADFAERSAQTRDEAAQRAAEIGALHKRVAALDEEIRVAVVAAALDGAQNDAAITKARDERSAATRQITMLTERNETALLVIAELQRREHEALVDENTVARRKLAGEYEDLSARIRALLLEAGSLQDKAVRVRHEEAELAGAACVQRPGGLSAETFIEFHPLGPDLSRIAEAYAIADSGDHEKMRLMRVS